MPRPANPNFVFFGTDEFAVIVLDELKRVGFLPALIVTAPDQPHGRRLVVTPPPVKLWAQTNNVEFVQPRSLKSDTDLNKDGRTDLGASLRSVLPSLFIVASYGKIIPKNILSLPVHGALNVHPSLLPKYRGPAPIQAAILNGNEETGVTIMLMDEQVDHGPILKSQSVKRKTQNNYLELRDELAHLGGQLLAETIPDWLAGKIKPVKQDHAKATFTKMIKKEDGQIDVADLAAKSEEVYRKFLAYQLWPGLWFRENARSSTSHTSDRRVKITGAALENGILQIKKVIPEGKSEMTWGAYQRGL